MKKVLITIPIILTLAGAAFFNLPFEVTRASDIEFGNELVEKIERNREENNEIPESGNWDLLKALGFKFEHWVCIPEYSKINETEYELIYVEGFDGPYLLYNSRTKKWTIDFPTIPDRLKEKNTEEIETNFNNHICIISESSICYRTGR